MTKQLKPALSISLGLLALGASTGCISHTETTDSEPPRARIAFASEKAGRVFCGAPQSTPPSRRRTEKRTETPEQATGNVSPFNKAVAFADTDRNAEISEAEADIFATAWTRSEDRG